MPDTPPNPPAAEAADIFAEMAERRDRAIANNSRTKAALFAVLAQAGVAHVTAHFNGSGDSGAVESIDAFDADRNPMAVPAASVAVIETQWLAADDRILTQPAHTAVEHLALSYLSLTHGGWEIASGAFGTIDFDVAAGTAKLDYNARIEETLNHQHDF